MNGPLVSIVIPIYNSEKYLNSCLDSLINQNYTNLEIILINDGSNDSSAKICETYAKDDSRIAYYIKNNGGAASARNYGMNIAKGKYLLFIDSDDYLLSNSAVSFLVNKSELYNLDILFFSGEASDDIKQKKVRCQWYQHTKNLNVVESGINNLEKAVRCKEYNTHVGMRFVNLEYLNSINLRFNESMRALEDEEFSFIMHTKANKVINVSNVLYHRRYRPNSIMTSLDKYAYATNLIKLIKILINDDADNCQTIKNQLYRKINGHIYQLQGIYNNSDPSIRINIEKDLLINREILNNAKCHYSFISKRTINNISKNVIVSKIFFVINNYKHIFIRPFC